MSKSIHVTFSDGTSHTYDDIPDDVTQEQVNERAKSDYPNKEVEESREGAHPFTPEKPPEEAPPTAAEKAVGGAQVAYDLANQFLSSPVGHAAEIITGGWGAKKGIVNPIVNAMQNRAPIAPAPAPAPSGLVDAQGRPMARPAPVVPQAAAKVPPVGGPAAEQGVNFIQRITQEYAPRMAQAGKYLAPVVNNPVMRVLGSAPVVGAQMALTPSTLNANEEEELRRRRAMAPTIR